MDNSHDTRFDFLFLKEVEQSIRSCARKDFESTTMPFEKITKFFGDGKNEMTIFEVIRPSRNKIIHPKIRLRLRARVAKSRFARKRKVSYISAIITFIGNES